MIELVILICLIILIVLIWKPVKKAVLGALDARADKIRSDLDEAQRLHEEAKSLLAKYQRQLHEGEQLATDILAQAEAQRQRFEEKMRADYDLAMKRRTTLAMERIAQEEAQAVQEVRAARPIWPFAPPAGCWSTRSAIAKLSPWSRVRSARSSASWRRSGVTEPA